MNASCGTCLYWFHEQPENPAGLCRRYPPIPLLIGMQNIHGQPANAITQSAFPPITADGWCGEHAEGGRAN